MSIINATLAPRTAEGYHPVVLRTDAGDISLRYYHASLAVRAIAYVGGVGGGWDTPASGLYPRLSTELLDHGISSLRVRFRSPTVLSACVEDLDHAVMFLLSEGVKWIGLIGHSLGGAVVIQVAARNEPVETVVTLAAQSLGAETVSTLGPHCSILLIHGMADRVLPASSSVYLYNSAAEPKRILLLREAGHVLDEAADEVHDVVRDWILERLAEEGSAGDEEGSARESPAEK